MVDQFVLQGESVKLVTQRLAQRHPQDAKILSILEKLTLNASGTDVIEARLEDLESGMILVKPIQTIDGTLLLPRGQELSQVAIQRIKNFVKNERIRQTFVVRRTGAVEWTL